MIKDARPYHSNKSDILEVIAPKSKAANATEVVVRGLVIDLSMIIRSEAVVSVTSISVKDDVQRLDIVLDTYDAFSIKSVTREESGVGSRVLFEYNDPLPDDFNSFLKNDDNKTDLNKLISQLAIRPTSWT